MSRFKHPIEKILEEINTIPGNLIRIKINKKWLEEQIKNGSIRKDDYKKTRLNYFAGVPVVITDEVHTFELEYVEK